MDTFNDTPDEYVPVAIYGTAGEDDQVYLIEMPWDHGAVLCFDARTGKVLGTLCMGPTAACRRVLATAARGLSGPHNVTGAFGLAFAIKLMEAAERSHDDRAELMRGMS